MKHQYVFLVLAGLLLAALPEVAARDLAVVISEIMYHPAEEPERGEYVELTNLGPGGVELEGWSLSGGIDFVFPAGSRLRDGSSVVVAANAAWLRDRYGIENIYGDFARSLSNGGERLVLRNAAGQRIDEVEYDDDLPWPRLADGRGVALELAPGESDNHFADLWHPGLTPGGTPGRPNRVAGSGAGTATLIAPGSDWRYRKGNVAPPAAWRDPDYTGELTWPVGRAGFGYGDGDDATVLADMENAYLTVYLRHSFEWISGEHSNASLHLAVDYDDGFVAYLNGAEVARANVGANPSYNTPADGDHEAGGPEVFDLSAYHGLLREGRNVLAVEGHNRAADSSDFSLHPWLTVVDSNSLVMPRLSEIASASGALSGYIEITADDDVDLSGWRLRDAVGVDRYIFQAGTSLLGGTFLTVPSGLLVVAVDGAGNWYLMNPAGDLKDALPAPPIPGWVVLRDPDHVDREYLQEQRSPGTANRIALPSPRLVWSEINAHPLSPTETEWVEISNPNGYDVSLAGWSISGGVDIGFPGAASVPAGGYVLVAATPDLLSASAAVLGPWIGRLANRGEALRLVDPYGNVVEEVHYSREEGFPSEPDTTSRTLERIHPALYADSPGAWAASTPGGTPGAANSSFTASPSPTIADVRHAPLFPAPGESVEITARIASPVPAGSVLVHYGRDGVAE